MSVPLKGHFIKLHNRRVALYRLRGGDFALCFRRLIDRKTREVVRTSIRLSPEAFQAVARLCLEEMTREQP